MSNAMISTVKQLNALTPGGLLVASLPVVSGALKEILRHRYELRGQAQTHMQAVVKGLFEVLAPATVIGALRDAFGSVDESIRKDREQLLHIAQQCGMPPEVAAEMFNQHTSHAEVSRRAAWEHIASVATVTIAVIGGVATYVIAKR